jgi:putative pyruvate formate lyase activating enzyme
MKKRIAIFALLLCFAALALVSAAGAKDAGLSIPVVCNTGGYESTSTLKMLDGLIDIYLTDFKYASPELARRYSRSAANAGDYPQIALAALLVMLGQTGPYAVESDGMGGGMDDGIGGGMGGGMGGGIGGGMGGGMGDGTASGICKSGVIVRHLLLPGQLDDAKAVLRLVFEAVGNDVCYSIMNQYTPPATGLPGFPELQRTVTEAEYDELIDFACDLGISQCFIQEGGTADEGYIPAFDLTGVLARP